jgi:hypothetical protein
MLQANHRRHVLLKQDKPADEITYDNTASGLTADNVQDAIDEVAAGGSAGGFPPQLAWAGVR